jgi:hypothetical protein
MKGEKFPEQPPHPELDTPPVELEIIQTPTSQNSVPEVIKIIDERDFDKDYPPLPSEQERNKPKKPTWH